MMPYNWKLEWEKLLLASLAEHNIPFEKTSFKISSDLKKGRENNWENTICSGQIVKIVKPSRKGSSLKIQAINSNSLPVIVGTIDIYDANIDYSTGIIGQLIEKKLEYSNGDTKNCLDFDQPIILISGDKIPQEILASKTLKLKAQAKKSGCFTSILFLLGFLIVLLIGHIS